MLRAFSLMWVSLVAVSGCVSDPDLVVTVQTDSAWSVDATPAADAIAEELCGEGWEFGEWREISIVFSDDGRYFGRTSEHCTEDGLVTVESDGEVLGVPTGVPPTATVAATAVLPTAIVPTVVLEPESMVGECAIEDYECRGVERRISLGAKR